MTPLWAIRILFLGLCMTGGYAISQVRPEFIGVSHSGLIGMMMGFGFGGWMVAVDEMLKGFSLRAFSAITFGLLLGTVVALLVDRSGLFENAEANVRWLIRLGLFLGFGYIGIILAMRSNKEDFSLIIPYVRFAPQNKPDNLLLLETSVIIDGRRGLEMLNRLQRNTHTEVRIHDGDFPEEPEVDTKLIHLARNLNARLYTNDYNLARIAELQKISYVNLQ